MLFTVKGLDMEIIHPLAGNPGVLLLQLRRIDNNLLKKLHQAVRKSDEEQLAQAIVQSGFTWVAAHNSFLRLMTNPIRIVHLED